MGCNSSKTFIPSDIPGQSEAVVELMLKLNLGRDDLNIIYAGFCNKEELGEIVLDKLYSNIEAKSDLFFIRSILVYLKLGTQYSGENFINFQDFFLHIWILLTIRDASAYIYDV